MATDARPLVLFDLDDTLFDHSGTTRTALAQWVRSRPALAAPPFEQVLAVYREALEAAHWQLLRGELSLDGARIQRTQQLYAAFGRTLDAEAALAEAWDWRALYQTQRRAVPGAAELLQALRGRATVGIVSNNQTAEQEGKLADLGLAPLIDMLLTSEAAGCAKPDPAIFALAVERCGGDPARTVMVGDAWETDILGARAAGLRAVWFNRWGTPAPEPSLAREVRSLSPTAALVSLLTECA